jgi:small-conductance mechanosensitive channel
MQGGTDSAERAAMDFGAIEETGAAALNALAEMPSAVTAALLAILAIAVAVATHSTAVAVIRRAAADRPFVMSLVAPMQGPFRLALVLLALNLAAAAAPLDPEIKLVLSRLLQLAFIGFIGWMLVAASNLAAKLYLRRFNLEAEDNLQARKQVTQVRVLSGALNTLIVVMTIAAALMTFEQVRQYGVSLFASAGIAGIVVGLAARPMLSNLIAGVQLAITQPIRIEDAVIVENEFGFVEEINATYIVIRLWDWRRLVVPLSHFIEKPFQNWTRESASLIGSVYIRADYTVPVEQVRSKLNEIVKSTPLWDGRVVALQVTDADDRTVELRALASARTAPAAFDLRCLVREQLIDYLAREHPRALPHRRLQSIDDDAPQAAQAEQAFRARQDQRAR